MLGYRKAGLGGVINRLIRLLTGYTYLLDSWRKCSELRRQLNVNFSGVT